MKNFAALIVCATLPAAAVASTCTPWPASTPLEERLCETNLCWTPPTRDVDDNPINAETDLKRYDVFLLDDQGAPQKIAEIPASETSCQLLLTGNSSHQIAMRSIGRTEDGRDDPSALSNVCTRP